MTSVRATIGCACLALACGSDRGTTTQETEEHKLRGESSSISLPSDPARLASVLGVATDSLRVAGEERYRREEYDSARAIWQVELKRSQSAADSAAEARVRMWLGLAAWRLGDFKISRTEGERSLELKRRLRLDAELARSFNALGLLAWHEGRLRDALRNFDSAKVHAKRNADSTGVARALSNTPLVQVELGDFDGARNGFLSALNAGKSLDDDLIQGNALANLGMLEIRLGNATRAVTLLTEARTHYHAIEYGTGEANALGQLAVAWSQLGDLQRAMASADSALVIARAAGLQQEVAAELEVLADLHIQGGNPRLALRRLSEADSIDKAVGLHVERGVNLRRMAAILHELGEYPAAIIRAREAVAIHRKAEARAEEIYDRLQLAQSLSRNGQATKARAEADGAALSAAALGNPSTVRDVSRVAARVALDRRDPASALTHLKATSLSAQSADWRTEDLRAEAFFAVGRLDEAEVAGKRALSQLERERASLGVGPLRSVYLANRASPFSRLVAIHLAQHDTAGAFAIAASLPGRALSERLAGFVEGPKSLAAVAEGERMLLRAAALERALAELDEKERNGERSAALDHELATVRSAYEEQSARRAALPSAALLGLATVSAQGVQSRLGEGEAVLTFLSGPDRLDAFVVKRGMLRHAGIPLGDRALAQRVRLARELLGRPQNRAGVPVALADLHDLLLGAVDRGGYLAGVTRLLIVPHGSLGALPFAALWNRRSGKFLVEEHAIGYLPTVNGLASEPGESYKPSDRLQVFVPLSDSLPGTLTEARAIARIKRGAELRLGPASTKSGVTAALRDGASVHIASHGSHNSQNPLFSRMTVGSSSRPAREDPYLAVHEILGLRTSSALVFLSGCETGLGGGGASAFEPASEMGSLAHAFLVAGAQAVVATLWRVDDAESSRLSQSFYQQVQTGATPSDALGIAQRDAIKRRSGYTWAAYTIAGR